MRRGEARRTKRQGSYFQGEGGLLLRLLRLQALLARPSRFHERVANAVTFKTCYCTPSDSKPFGNGEGVPVSGTYVLECGTDPSNRGGLERGLGGLAVSEATFGVRRSGEAMGEAK
jgi:hypothetical protein